MSLASSSSKRRWTYAFGFTFYFAHPLQSQGRAYETKGPSDFSGTKGDLRADSTGTAHAGAGGGAGPVTRKRRRDEDEDEEEEDGADDLSGSEPPAETASPEAGTSAAVRAAPQLRVDTQATVRSNLMRGDELQLFRSPTRLTQGSVFFFGSLQAKPEPPSGPPPPPAPAFTTAPPHLSTQQQLEQAAALAQLTQHAQHQQQQQLNSNPFSHPPPPPSTSTSQGPPNLGHPGFPALAHLTSAAALALPDLSSAFRLPSPGPWGQFPSLPFNTQSLPPTGWPGLAGFNPDATGHIGRNPHDGSQQPHDPQQPQHNFLARPPAAAGMPSMPGFVPPDFSQYLSMIGYNPDVIQGVTSAGLPNPTAASAAPPAPTPASSAPGSARSMANNNEDAISSAAATSSFGWPNGGSASHRPASTSPNGEQQGSYDERPADMLENTGE